MKRYRFGNVDGVGISLMCHIFERMLSDELINNRLFNHNDYEWCIGVNVIKRINDIKGKIPLPIETGPNRILGINVIKSCTVELNEIVLRVRPDFSPSRQSEKTMTSYANLLKQIERNGNMNRRVKPEGRIKNVIFNDPATIVFWSDGMKTVVKAEGEPFDPEKGLAMAISKRVLGNKGNYYNEFKKWLPEEKAKWKDPVKKVCSSCKYFSLGPSSINTCLECLKGKNLPNWEKRDD